MESELHCHCIEEFSALHRGGSSRLATEAEVAFQAQNNQLLILLLGTGGSAILMTALAIYLAGRAVRPILNAAQTVESIGQGELGTRVQVQGQDEVATLGTNINQMAIAVGPGTHQVSWQFEPVGIRALGAFCLALLLTLCAWLVAARKRLFAQASVF